MNKIIKKTRPYLYVLPAFFFLCVFTYYPFVKSIYLSLFRYNMSTPNKVFIGFSNYVAIFHDPVFLKVVKNNILYSLGTIIVSVTVSMFLAIVMDEQIKHKTFYQVSLFYPNIIPMAAASMIWVWIFAPGYGMINYYIKLLGVPNINWLENSKFALVALMIVGIWKRMGYYMIIFIAGLQNIPKEIYNAGKIDGVTGLKRYLYITIPLLSPTTIFIVIIAIMDSFQAIDQVYLMTRGGPADATNMFVYYIYEQAFRFFDVGYSSALTSILLIVLLIITLISLKISSKRTTYYA